MSTKQLPLDIRAIISVRTVISERENKSMTPLVIVLAFGS